MKKDKEEKIYLCPLCKEEVPYVYYWKDEIWVCFDCFKKIRAKKEGNEQK